MSDSQRINQLGQPIGASMEAWVAPPPVAPTTITGSYVTLSPIDPRAHADDLQTAYTGDLAGWTYLPYGPFASVDEHQAWLETSATGSDPLFFAIKPHTADRVLGIASYLRINPADGVIEIGHIHLASGMQQSQASTEALTLMIGHAFELGYRRVEWKCDALNTPSRRAAMRLGLSFDGLFRQLTIYKGRNRDTAWYAATVDDWPALQQGYAAWLATENFDADGRQRRPLSNWTAPLLRTRDGLQTVKKENP